MLGTVSCHSTAPKVQLQIICQCLGRNTDGSRYICSKVCKNKQGLKIHQAQMKCLVQETAAQRTGPRPGETQEEPSPETPHRARNLQVPNTCNSKQSSPTTSDQVVSSKAAQAVATV